MCRQNPQGSMVKNYTKGQIWSLQDMVGNYRHPYLIISDNGGDDRNMHRVQAIKITSMRNKEVYGAVPIVLSNNEVSYLVPFNISFYTSNHFTDLGNYRGIVMDDIMTQSELINLCFNLYCVTNGFPTEKPYDEIQEEYERYLRDFWDKYCDKYEHRGDQNPVNNPELKYTGAKVMGENIYERQDQDDIVEVIDACEVAQIETTLVESSSISEVKNKGKLPPTSKWKDKELVTFVNIYNVTDRDQLMKNLNLGSKKALYMLKYHVSKEIEKRGIRLLDGGGVTN